MKIQVIGEISCTTDSGDVVMVKGQRPAQLLAVLAMTPGRPASDDRLASALWPDGELPSDPKATLRTYLSRLGNVIGREHIERTPRGYRLTLPPDAVDAHRFEAFAATARLAAEQQQWAAATDACNEALLLWGGVPYPSLSDWNNGTAEQYRLTELAANVHELHATCLLASNRSEDAVPALSSLVELHPLRESAWVLLMGALYRSGRQTEALSTFTRARTLLVEEHGVEPSAELRSAERAVLDRRDPVGGLGGVATPTVGQSATIGDQAPNVPTGLVGRTLEREQLVHRAVAAQTAEMTAVWGEAGVGKTSLVASVAADPQLTGTAIHWVRCDEPESGGLLRPIAALVRSLTRTMPPDQLSPRDLGALAILTPELVTRSGAPDVDADTSMLESGARRLRLFDAVTHLIATVARERSVLLIVEDLHWADASTVAALDHVMRNLARTPVHMVVTTRPMELDSEHPGRAWLAGADRLVGCEHVELTGLSRPEVAELLDQLAGSAAATHAERISRVTGGNPLFICELARSDLLSEPATGPDELVTALPTRVADALTKNLAELTPGARHLAAVISTMVGPARLDFLTEIVDQPDDVLDQLDELLDASVVTEELSAAMPAYRLRHELFRWAVMADLSAARRQRLHTAAAQVMSRRLEGGQDLLAVAAHHWFNAGASGDVAQTISLNERTARSALDSTAYDDALLHASRALTALGWAGVDPQPVRAANLHLIRADVHRLRGATDTRRSEASIAHELARNIDTGLMTMATVVFVGHRSTYGEPNPENDTLLQSALSRFEEIAGSRELEDGEHQDRAILRARSAQELHHAGDFDSARTEGAAALAEATDAGADDLALTELLDAYVFTLNHPDLTDERSDRIDEMRRHAEATRRPELIARSLVWSCALRLERGDRAGLHRDLEALAALDRRDLSPAVETRRRTLASVVATADGRLTDAITAAESAHELGLEVEPDNADQVLQAQLLRPLFELGTLGDAAPLVEMMADRFAGAAGWRAAAAYVHLAAGDRDRANDLLDTLFDDGQLLILPDLSWHQATVFATDVCVELERTDLAPVLIEALTPHAGRMVAMWDIALCGANDHWLGRLHLLLGDYTAAGRCLEAAVELNRAAGDLPALGRSRLEQLRLASRLGTLDPDLVEHQRAEAEAAGLVALATSLAELA